MIGLSVGFFFIVTRNNLILKVFDSKIFSCTVCFAHLLNFRATHTVTVFEGIEGKWLMENEK